MENFMVTYWECKQNNKFNLFIVILQYVFHQYNNIRINVLLQQVSTQESHRQADYLRTVNTLYPLQYYICIFCIRDPYALHCVSRKPGFIIYLDKSILCEAVGVVIAPAVRPTRTFRLSRVKPSTPARRRVHYKRDRSPT